MTEFKIPREDKTQMDVAVTASGKADSLFHHPAKKIINDAISGVTIIIAGSWSTISIHCQLGEAMCIQHLNPD
jgi:hypothetical protein